MKDNSGHLFALFYGLFFGTVFLQSGLDKVFNFQDNLGWLTGHFEKSPLAKLVPQMVGTITIVELVAGALSLIGGVLAILSKDHSFIALAWVMDCVALLMLFFGQRIAKDYAGAATIAAYFVVAILGIFAL
ncbi:MAG: DoxX family protein [Armatimonadetes bacterium]|nr:DoxX family protein [Armatimonadota bacterium]